MGIYERVNATYRSHRGAKTVYGQSEEGLSLFAMRAGEGAPRVLVQCAMHAREYITAELGLRLLGEYASAPPAGTVWVLPLSNPDGVRVAEEGAAWLSAERRRSLEALRRGRDWSLFKANADGVDLNVNFDARWGMGAANVFSPDFANYVGPYPFSARETRALAAFTERVRPDATVSFHAKGEVIYWEFHQSGRVLARDRRIAEKVSGACGYPLGDPGVSAGGYKDWCVEKRGIPALTVEVGSDDLSHPIGLWALDGIYSSARKAIPALLEGLREI